MPRNETNGDAATRQELEAIKKLLIFGLKHFGASQDDIAAALGVNQSTISRMFPRPEGNARSKRASGRAKRASRR